MAKTKTPKKETKESAEPKKTKPAVAASAETLVATTGQKTQQPLAASTEDKVMLHVKLHGKEFVGTVISDKATKTVTVEWERRVLLKKYERYERKYSRVYAHNPATMNARTGDIVRIKETRPLSKTKNFVVVEIMKKVAS